MATENNSQNGSHWVTLSQEETRFHSDEEYTQELRELQPGEQLGKYQLVEEVGQGGMGFIWKALDTVSGMPVALKFFSLDIQQNEDLLEDLRRVFVLTQRLQHDGIRVVLSLEKDSTFGYFQVVKWLEGMTLKQLCETYPNGKLPADWIPVILKKIAEALDYAHRNGVLHRDIKPSNIFLTFKGRSIRGVQLIDFGISAEAPQASDKTSQFQMTTSGTPAYMALEQHLGEKQDARTDQFSLAVVAYELYAGQRPFHGQNTPQYIASLMRDTPVPIPGLPAYANEALSKALSQQRKDRFDTCCEFVQALTTAPKLEMPSIPPVVIAPPIESKTPAQKTQYTNRKQTQKTQYTNRKQAQKTQGDTQKRSKELLMIILGVALILLLVSVWIVCTTKNYEWSAAKKAADTAERVARETSDNPEPEPPAEPIPVAPKAGGQKVETVERLELPGLELPAEVIQEGPKAGERMVKTVDGIEYAFRWCPAGTFTMGGERDEWNGSSWISKKDQHEVTLTQGFWMMETEVTQAMWRSVMGESISDKAKQGTYGHDLYGEGSNYPMYYVSWDDCQAFCKKLTSKIGMKITLPTEAQWEYACRAGTTGPYAGDLDKMGWYDGNSGSHTHPVRQKQANAWGLYDMYGNVWEWCQDWKGAYPTGSVEDPTGPNSGSYRVYRGGSWYSFAQYCRSAYRFRYSAGGRSSILGFRAVGCPSR